MVFINSCMSQLIRLGVHHLRPCGTLLLLVTMSVAKSYKLDVSDELLNWIDNRVQTARVIPDVIHAPNEEWADGTPTTVVNEFVTYWKEKYDWRNVEKGINNTFKMFTMDITDADEVISLHFVHHRSERKDAIPLLFSHGWPGNFLEVHLFKVF